MDHLPYPDNAAYPPVQIPYLASEAVAVYDGSNFSEFPALAGWCEAGGYWHDCDPLIAAARAQTWLFFGLLREVLGSTFTEASFVAGCGEHRRISTRNTLPTLLKKHFPGRQLSFQSLFETPLRTMVWFIIYSITFFIIFFVAFLRERVSNIVKSKRRLKYTAAMIKAEKEIRRVEEAFPHNDDVQLVCLSIRALLWSLRNAFINHEAYTVNYRSILELSPSPYLRRLLLERGMCPHHLATLEERSSVALLHYLSGLHRPVGPHGGCSDDFCSANILDPLTYETKHIDEDCRCEMIESDTAEVLRTVDAGEVPVLRVSLRGAAVQIDTERAGFDNPYVAISHAWSGGLGNLHALSLPACQLRRIYHLLMPQKRTTGTLRKIRQKISRFRRSNSESNAELGTNASPITDSCVIWMDTLCLPKQAPQRSLAIDQMFRIYAGAQQVIVLDKGMRKVRADQQEEEMLANLVSCAWMSRCWTFNESRLAQELLINVGDSIRDPFILYNQVAHKIAMVGPALGLPGHGTWTDELQLRRELASNLRIMRPLKDQKTTDFDELVDVWNELGNRTTSWQVDKIRILAIMLDLSPYEIESIPSDNMKLKGILRTREELPISFLFNPSSNSHGGNDDSWVPTSLRPAVDSWVGSMRKISDIKSGEAGFSLHLTRDEYFFVESKQRPLAQHQDMTIQGDGFEDVKFGITLTEAELPQMLQDQSFVATSTNYLYLYLFHDFRPLNKKSLRLSGRGCCFKMLKEDHTSKTVAHISSFSYTAMYVSKTPGQPADLGRHSRQMKIMGRTLRLKVKCDWRQWPALHFHRSRAARSSTTTHHPTHPFAACLLGWEFAIGGCGVILVLVIRPDKQTTGVQPSAGHWIAYACCAMLLLGRLLYVIFKEIPFLNTTLKRTEYEKWHKSFDRPIPDAGTRASEPRRARVSQYRPWWVSGGFMVLGVGLLVTGLVIGDLNLLEVTLTGGFVIAAYLPVGLIEAFWRMSVFHTVKQRLLDLLFGLVINGHAVSRWSSLMEFNTSISHGRNNLTYAFQDPLYIPEDTKWWW